MGEFLDKLSRYNIINYLLPGTLFAVLGDAISSYSFVQDDLLVSVFLYYFIGLIISRIGSLVIEPIFKFFGIIKFVNYEDYLQASEADAKIEVLSEENNMYRTLCALFVSLCALYVVEELISRFAFLQRASALIALVTLLVLFVFSYKKQTNYVVKRVKAALGK